VSGSASSEVIELTIGEDEAGERLDAALARRDLGFSRSVLQRFLEEGRVTVDDQPATRKTKARAGMRVAIRPAPPPPSEALPEDLPLAILFEDEHLVIVDKAPGMVVHPAPGHSGGTLVNALLHHLGEAQAHAGDPARPGIVHRLDKGTSGVMVVAKTALTHERLVRLFQAHDIERTYRAIARGETPEAVTYDTLHGRHVSDRKRFTSRVVRGRRAITHVRTLSRLHGASEIECRLETGRTHQIRVHLADHGHALVGDPLYGSTSKDPRVAAVAAELGRQALHAAVLGFRHPITGEVLRFETEPPADHRAALAALAPLAR
jgi:23S rRNA pseudouridine1911/1915/1917 synthase